MLAFIKGYVERIGDGFVVIEAGNIGYELSVSTNTLLKIKDEKGQVKLYTYLNLNMRDNDVSLFGFATEKEKELFTDLTSVSGIGGKLALTILSGISLDALINAIKLGDIKTLSVIKGVGKKTAERLVVELKDKIGAGLNEIDGEAVVQLNTNEVFSEAIDLLVSLGFTKTEAQAAVLSASKQASDISSIVALALKNRNNGGN